MSSYFHKTLYSRLKDSYRLVFDKKAYMKIYNARPEVRKNVREAVNRHYWANRDNPDFRAKKSEADRRYALSHWEQKKRRNREYFYRHRDRILERLRARIKFQGRTKSVGRNPRTGICSLCRHKGQTDIHHMRYDRNDLLAHTIELCDSCHNKQRVGSHYNKGVFVQV